MTQVLLGAAGAVYLALALIVLRPAHLITLALLAWSLNSLTLASEAVSVAGFALSVVFLGAALLKNSSENTSAIRRKPNPITYVPIVAALLGGLLLPSSLDFALSSRSVFELLMVGTLTWFVARNLSGNVVAGAAYSALGVIIAASVVAVVIGSPESVINSRWAGVTSNPNALGLIVLLWVALSFGRSRGVVLATALAGLTVTIMAGSRGATLALLVALAAGVWVGGLSSKKSPTSVWAHRTLVVALVLLGSWTVSGLITDTTSTSILRATDSGRWRLLQDNLDLFLQRPATGYGFGILATSDDLLGAHTFFLTIAVQLGITGIILTGLVIVLMLRTNWKSSPILAALVFGSLASLLFESWLFGAGSVVALSFWLSISALATDLDVQTASESVPKGEVEATVTPPPN